MPANKIKTKKMNKQIIAKVSLLTVLALLVAGAGFWYQKRESSDVLGLSLKDSSGVFSQDETIEFTWNADSEVKEVFLTIYPSEEGKARISERIKNDGEYNIPAYMLGAAGRYEVKLSDAQNGVSESITIETVQEVTQTAGATLTQLGGGYITNGTKLFYQGSYPEQELRAAKGDVLISYKPADFKVFGEGAALVNGMYFIENKEFDPKALYLPAGKDIKILNKYLATLFTYGDAVIRADETVSSFEILGDAKTFRFIPETGYSYFVVNNTVYYDDAFTVTALKGLDAATVAYAGTCSQVEAYGTFYVKDKFAVIVDSEVVSRDPANFIAYKLEPRTEKDAEIPASTAYAKDSTAVYYNCTEKIQGADAKTFEVLGNGYAKDMSRTYRFGKPVESSNP